MDAETKTYTTAEAVGYIMDNEETLNLTKMMQDFVMTDPQGFLEILGGGDAMGLVAKLATADPNTFMRLATKYVSGADDCRIIIGHIEEDGRVDAIRHIRNVFGLGLKESMDVVNNVQQELFLKGRCSTGFTNATRLGAAEMVVFNRIMVNV
jgi:hypothetical protein